MRSPRRRHRLRRYLVACSAIVLAITSGLIYYYVFCNVAIHSHAWMCERIETAVPRGLDYLYEAGTFGKPVEEGGETPPHFFFLEFVLQQYDHPGLREQMTRAKLLNKHNPRWRMFFGMPGWPAGELTPQDYANIEYMVNHWEENFWAEWLLHGIYPAWTSLRPQEQIRLLQDTSRLSGSYQLTHALLTYLWMKKSNPKIAQERMADELISRVNDRLWTLQHWDGCTSDIYNERIAFWLYMDQPPPIKRRWIERIILAQNSDGGWTYHKSLGRLFGQLAGFNSGAAQSSPHATFLALYSLAEYKRRYLPAGICD